jgi:hypothetical protein
MPQMVKVKIPPNEATPVANSCIENANEGEQSIPAPAKLFNKFAKGTSVFLNHLSSLVITRLRDRL